MKQMNLDEIKVMFEHGVSLEAIHEIHGPLIQCPIDQKNVLDSQLKGQGMKLGDDGRAVYISTKDQEAAREEK